MISSGLTWQIARAGGLMAYGLLTASVAIGLVLSLKWRSPRWTRFITTELHRFVTLLALVFIALHTLMVAVDPFIQFTPLEVFVPFVSHYRPLWVALGIVGSYLVVAVYASEWIRPHVGYQWWRRFHFISFVAFGLALVHGLGTGSDTRTPWAIAMYAASVVLVAALIAVRLVPPNRTRWHEGLAVAGALGLAVLGFWSLQGPLQAGWNAVANNDNGSGSSLAGANPSPAPTATPAPRLPFSDTLTGELSQAGDGSVVLAATLGSTHDRLTLRFPSAQGGQLTIDGATAALTAPNGDTCTGPVTTLVQTGVVATCQGISSGSIWLLQVSLSTSANGFTQGRIDATPE